MSGLIFHLIAHTHWDREWYLPRASFQARLVPVLDDLLARLPADPAYRSFMLDGQTILVEDYLRARPEREPDIRALVKTGRLQLGPWYVLADELIPSGEALLRNLLLGAADAERLGGRLEVLYSPDAFGHPAVWPDLAREFGIRSGVVWRGLGGEPGQERDLYRWAGRAGEVLLWHLPPQGYEIGAGLPADAKTLPAAWAPVRDTLVTRAQGKHVPVFVGADHHAAHPELPRLRDLLAALEPENAVRISRLDEFFQAAAADGAGAPRIAGELRWSYRYVWTLQGVHGTRLPLKRRNAELELWLERIAEPLSALARRVGGTRDRRPLLELAWRTLVQCQFHDAIAGCCADAVADAVAVRFDSVKALAGEISRGAAHELAGHDPDAARDREASGVAAAPRLVLWNPACRPRGGVTIADVTFFRRDVLVGPSPTGGRRPRTGEGYRPFALQTADGRFIPVQVLDRQRGLERLDAVRHYPDEGVVDRVRIAFRAPALAGLGLAAFAPRAPLPLPTADRVTVKGRTLGNRFVEVSLEATGALALHDRRTGERFFDVLRLEDGGDVGDTYSYCPPVRDRIARATGPITVRRLAAGPLVAALEARFALKTVAARLVVTLHADSPVVRCLFEIENRAPWHRLRARVPTAITEVPAVAGSAFGAERRDPVRIDPAEFPLETPVPTAPLHRFAALAEGRRGLAVLLPGFGEFEPTPGGDLVLTLLRAVGELSRDDLPTRPGHAGWPTPTPGAQCLGHHHIPLALVTVSQEDVARRDVVLQHWEDVFLPLHGWWLRDATTLAPGPGSLEVALEGRGLVLSAVKPAVAGSGMILRCYNVTAERVAGAWRFGDAVKSAHRVRADEKESVALVLENRGRTVRFAAGPGEIVTILVT